jgi:hypothetical protein
MRAELIERGGGRMSDELAASAAFLARVRDDDHEPTPLRIRATTELLASAMRYRTLDKASSYTPTMADLMDWAFCFPFLTALPKTRHRLRRLAARRRGVRLDGPESTLGGPGLLRVLDAAVVSAVPRPYLPDPVRTARLGVGGYLRCRYSWVATEGARQTQDPPPTQCTAASAAAP